MIASLLSVILMIGILLYVIWMTVILRNGILSFESADVKKTCFSHIYFH